MAPVERLSLDLPTTVMPIMHQPTKQTFLQPSLEQATPLSCQVWLFWRSVGTF